MKKPLSPNDPVIITVHYIDKVADHSEINHFPKQGVDALVAAIDGTSPQDANKDFPDTCVVEFTFDPSLSTMTCRLVK